jgi:uncharacterized protein (TIGR03437 family)
MNTGQVTATFNNNDPLVTLAPMGDGIWSGTWASRSRQQYVEITARAQLIEPKIQGEVKLRGGVNENPRQPAIASGGVLNAASFRANAPLAPGSYLSIFGANLAANTWVAEKLPLPMQLAETLALVAGRPLPIHFTSSGQVNAILPYGVSENTWHQVIVRQGNSYSLPEPLLVATSEPAIFTLDGSGRGPGHVYTAAAEGLRLADAVRPAKPGEVVVIYATGLGPVNPAVAAGEPAPPEPLSRTVNPVTVTIQGFRAQVLFSGLAPGYAGLYQLNVRVPDEVTPDGSAVVVINVGEQSSSPPVTMAVGSGEEGTPQ